MKITVSGKEKDIKEGTTVAKLIEDEKVETPEYITVSINENFIQKDEIPTKKLQDGDVVEFLYFMGGGQ